MLDIYDEKEIKKMEKKLGKKHVVTKIYPITCEDGSKCTITDSLYE